MYLPSPIEKLSTGNQNQGLRSKPRRFPSTLHTEPARLTHLVLARSLGHSSRVIRSKLIGDLDVQVTLILIIWLVLKNSFDLLSLLNSQHITQIEHSLLPVRVFCVWSSREADRLVTGSEVNVKPCDESMDEVISAAVKRIRNGEGQISSCACVEVESKNGSRVGNNSLHFDGIDKGLCERSVLERGVVEAIDVVPN
jgi:hypothetical protein